MEETGDPDPSLAPIELVRVIHGVRGLSDACKPADRGHRCSMQCKQQEQHDGVTVDVGTECSGNSSARVHKID
jgi:hypothetical protein